MYELVIIGAGPAGLTAAIYAQRAGIKTLVLEKLSAGGQLLLTEKIENYPGFSEGINSVDLAERLTQHAKELGAEIKDAKVIKLEKATEQFKIKTESAQELLTKAVIIATGAEPKSLNIPGEKELVGKGVSYCATCDGPLYRGKEVVVIGGGNSAIEEALFLARFVKKVIVIHRRDKLRAVKILEEKAKANEKIEFIWESSPLEILGKVKVEALRLKNLKTNQETKLTCDGVFIFVGFMPNTEFLKNTVDLNQEGYIITDDKMQTYCAGIFACGDCRVKSLYQVVTACADGAVAVDSVYKYLTNK